MSYKLRWQKILYFVLVSLAAFITMYPLIWLVGASFTPERYIFEHRGLVPSRFTTENYVRGWRGVEGVVSFADYFVNSFVIVTFCVIGTLISCSMAGFAFARLQFDLKSVWFAIMLLSLMLPMHVTLIPRYIMFYRIGWVDTYLPLTVPSFFATGSFFIFLFVQFIRGLPSEIDQAAVVDGCNPIDIYWRIILPLSKPALVTAAIFTFYWTWNNFFSQLLYISDPRRYTIALGLRAFMDSTSASAFGQMFAMSVVSLIPVLIFFVLSQKLIIEGIATTGLKG